MEHKSRGSFADQQKGAKHGTQDKKHGTQGPASSKRKSVSPGVSFGYNSMFADDEHIVRHSLSSVEGMPVLDAEQITEQAEALHQQRVKAGFNEQFEHPFSETPAELEREARLEADVEANEENN